MKSSYRRNLILFNPSDEIREILVSAGVEDAEIYAYHDEAETLSLICRDSVFSGLVICMETSAAGVSSAEQLMAVCAASVCVPPILAMHYGPTPYLCSPFFTDILSFPHVVDLDISNSRNMAMANVRAFFELSSASPAALAQAMDSLGILWRKSLRIYRHDRANCLRRFLTLADSRHFDDLTQYLHEHGKSMLLEIDRVGRDLCLSAERYLRRNLEAVSEIRQVVQAERLALCDLLQRFTQDTIHNYLNHEKILTEKIAGYWQILHPQVEDYGKPQDSFPG
jgi:hypothetical protein